MQNPFLLDETILKHECIPGLCRVDFQNLSFYKNIYFVISNFREIFQFQINFPIVLTSRINIYESEIKIINILLNLLSKFSDSRKGDKYTPNENIIPKIDAEIIPNRLSETDLFEIWNVFSIEMNKLKKH